MCPRDAREISKVVVLARGGGGRLVSTSRLGLKWYVEVAKISPLTSTMLVRALSNTTIATTHHASHAEYLWDAR